MASRESRESDSEVPIEKPQEIDAGSKRPEETSGAPAQHASDEKAAEEETKVSPRLARASTIAHIDRPRQRRGSDPAPADDQAVPSKTAPQRPRLVRAMTVMISPKESQERREEMLGQAHSRAPQRARKNVRCNTRGGALSTAPRFAPAASSSPGPGAYAPVPPVFEEERRRKEAERRRAGDFGTAERMPSGDSDTPGVGSYEAAAPRRRLERSCSFATAPRRLHDRAPTAETVGPGAYDTTKTTDLAAQKKPGRTGMFVQTSPRFQPPPSFSPGPAVHSDRTFVEESPRERARRATHFGTAPKLPERVTPAPGPGAYAPEHSPLERTNSAAKFGTSPKIPEPPAKSPGPAAYVADPAQQRRRDVSTFGTTERMAPEPMRSPGPLAYQAQRLRSSDRPALRRSASFGTSPRLASQRSDSPGPLAYETRREVRRKPKTSTFGTAPRMPAPRSDSPGPLAHAGPHVARSGSPASPRRGGTGLGTADRFRPSTVVSPGPGAHAGSAGGLTRSGSFSKRGSMAAAPRFREPAPAPGPLDYAPERSGRREVRKRAAPLSTAPRFPATASPSPGPLAYDVATAERFASRPSSARK